MRKLNTTPAGFILTPGASADRDHPTLVAIDDGLPEIPVVRLTLGTTSVPSAVRKINEAAVELAMRLEVPPRRLAFGGRSFGGRSCSVAIAEGMPACGAVMLSYPLHPPGKPENLRVDHFPQLGVPSLFISGRKDPFGNEAEFTEHLAAVKGRTGMKWIPGNHSPKGQDDTIVAMIRQFFGLPKTPA